MKTSIMLCHADEDQSFVHQLWSELERAGADVWYREQHILVGDSNIEKFSEALQTHTHFGIVLSVASASCPNVVQQLRAAVACKARTGRPTIIPIIVDDATVPEILLDIKPVDFRNTGIFINNLNMLKRSLGLRETAISSPMQSLDPAELDTDDARLRYFIHEIAAEITPLLGHVDTAKVSLRDDVDESALRAIERLGQGVGRLRYQIAKFRYLLKFENGIASPALDSMLDLKAIVARVADALSSDFLRRDISVRIVATFSGPLLVRGDAMLIEVALYNVMDNVLKYSFRGTECMIAVDRSASMARLMFSNTSKYMDGKHVFLQGSRGSNTEHQRGAGAGLAFVAHSVRSHGGDVSVTSRKLDGEKGAFELRIDLPKVGSELDRAGAAENGSPSSSQLMTR